MSVDPQTQSLFDAIVAVDVDQVKLAIGAGAAINRSNERGQTPLAMACRQGNLEIVDLLVAAGAQMQSPNESIPQSRTLATPALNNSTFGAQQPIASMAVADSNSFDPEVSRLPARDLQIPFENLIDLINQPTNNNATEIEQFIFDDVNFGASDTDIAESPVQDRQIQLENLIDSIDQPKHNHPPEIKQFLPTTHQRLGSEVLSQTTNKVAANWQDIDSDAEATYTFDLDEAFAIGASSTPGAINITDMFVESELTMTSLNRPAHEVALEVGETYVFDLSPDLDRLTAGADLEPDSLSMPMGSWGEGETYVLDDFLPTESEVQNVLDVPLQNFNSRRSNLDDLFIDEDQFIQNDTWEEGETYAVDLDDLGLSDFTSTENVQTKSNLDDSLLAEMFDEHDTATAGDDGDEPDYDPDTQTTTDIFGQAKTQQSDVELAPVYEENATNTSLMAATIDGDIDLAQQAIEAGASLDRYDWNMGYSPLGMAIDRSNRDLVDCLLTAGANPHCGNTTTTALGLAAERGEVEIIQMLLPRGIDVNAPVGQDGWTALLSAIKNGHRSVVQLLVTAGANVNVWSRGETPILLAAKCEEREIYHYLYPLVSTVIRLCADRDGEHLLQATHKRRIRAQNRPVEKLIEMARVGNIDEINRAIEVGIEIDEIGAKGHTALMAAAYYGHRSVVNTLLAAGADPNLLSDDDGLGVGMTALMLAAGSFFASNRQHLVQLTIAGGADVNQRGAEGRTAIFYAALAGSGYTDCVETLIAAGADLDLRDDRGHTLLTLVAAAENYQMLNLLIQSGASMVGLESIQLIQAAAAGNVDRVQSLLATKVNLDLDRGAAIGNAAAAGHTKIVELLIRAGANVNLRDKLGFTPIASAAYAGYGEIVQLLIDAGADIQAPAGDIQSYSALEYAQMGLYKFDRDDLQHAQIIRQLEQVSGLAV